MNGNRIDAAGEAQAAFDAKAQAVVASWMREQGLSTKDGINGRHEELLRAVTPTDTIRIEVSNNQFNTVNQDRIRLACALEAEAFVLEVLARSYSLEDWAVVTANLSTDAPTKLPNISYFASAPKACVDAVTVLDAQHEPTPDQPRNSIAGAAGWLLQLIGVKI